MGSHGTDEVMTPSEMEPNCSEAIVEIKIKTLDSQTYTLRVNKYMPVPALKEQIATVTGVLSEQQRLICRGKVLKDDQLLSAYHVEDGHTLHLVVRQPFHSSSTSGAGSTGPERMPNQSGADPVASSTRGQGNTVAAHSVVLGTFNVSDQGDAAMSDVNRFLSAVLTSVGLVNRGARNEESDSGVTGPERRERLVGTTVMMDPAPRHQPSLATYRAQLDSLHGGAFRFPTSMSAGPLLPLVIPDSLTTLSQYLQNMRQEFSINGQDHDINLPAGEAHNLESHNPDTVARADLVQGGLPTPAALAEVAMSTRQFLIEQVGDCLSQLARRLQEEANVTDPMVRTSIQSSAMRTGVLLQNAGALLLELGRATMTLRMGQTTSEAVVNAGPPVFISTTGPNPIMVQSLPFIPGTGFGTIPMGIMHPGHTLANGALGTGFVPRTIDIRIRTGSSGSADQGEHAAGTQVGASDQARPTGSGISMQNVSPSSGFPSVATESGGVRVVPVRTVVAAVPAAVSRPASDASSGGALGVFYPLLARIQNLDPGHLNDASRSTRVGDHHRNTETDEHQVSESSIRSQNVYSTRENSSINFCSSDTAPQHQGGFVDGEEDWWRP